jgi:hypothetical protein
VARLLDHECYRLLKPVMLEPVLQHIGRIEWVDTASKCASINNLDRPLPLEFQWLLRTLSLGGKTERHFLRKLAPKQGIAPHIDDWIPEEKDWRRFQVPLVSHPDILMRWPDDGIEVHLEPGFLYEVRFDRMHEVVNPTDCERIHLQIDQVDATI